MSTIGKQVQDIIERLNEEHQKAVLAFAEAAAKNQTIYGIPKWEDRKTLYPDKKISPADWIILHYDPLNKTVKWGQTPITKADIRSYDKDLYQAYATQKGRWLKKEIAIPDELLALEDNPSERVDNELAEHGIEDPKNVFGLFPDDFRKTDRLYQAAKRRAQP